MDIVIASKNYHKIREIRRLLREYPALDVYTLHDFPDYMDHEPTDLSDEELAKWKATNVAATLQRWSIADKSGLVVPALCGGSSSLSTPYRGSQTTDADNNKELLQALSGMSNLKRNAYFFCCLALASPQGLRAAVTASCEGYILEQERGGDGFGFESLFAKHDYDKSFAELDLEIRNRVSHRRKAFDKLANILDNLFQ